MIRIPGTAAYNFVSSNNCIEGDQLPEAVGVQMPWQRHPSRTHQQIIETRGFWMVSRQRPCLLVRTVAQPRCSSFVVVAITGLVLMIIVAILPGIRPYKLLTTLLCSHRTSRR